MSRPKPGPRLGPTDNGPAHQPQRVDIPVIWSVADSHASSVCRDRQRQAPSACPRRHQSTGPQGCSVCLRRILRLLAQRSPDLLGNRAERAPLGKVLRGVALQNPDRPGPDFRRKPPGSLNDSNLSRNGVSGNPGAVHPSAGAKSLDRKYRPPDKHPEGRDKPEHNDGCQHLNNETRIREPWTQAGQ